MYGRNSPDNLFLTHLKIKGLFTPSERGDLPFRKYRLLGGEVRPGPDARRLTRLQLGTLALDTLDLSLDEIAGIYTATDPGIVTESAVAMRLHNVREKLHVPPRTAIFPRAVAASVLEVEVPIPDDLQGLTEQDEAMIWLLARGDSYDAISTELGVAPGSLRRRVHELGELRGYTGRDMLVTSALMSGHLRLTEGVFDDNTVGAAI